MEIAKAYRSPDPSSYVCHYPVHQDGSCNGLQHYAALGRDQIGAQSVNLQPSQAPCDVYSDVVEMIEEERQKDACAGVDIAQKLENFVQRKAVKQTIMTTVYGVTPFGARLQIRDNIGDISNFPSELTFPASFYLAEKTFSCLQKMFKSAKEIQVQFTLGLGLVRVRVRVG
jgi:DNA-directed RNA polymerase